MSSPFTLYNNINTYDKETNIACGGGDNFDDIKNLDLVEFLGIHPAGAQLSARQTTQKCQDECDIRSWCTAFVYGTHGVSVAKSKLLFTGKECWLGKLQADTPPADKEVILQAGGATLEQCAKLCRQHASCHVFLWWPSGYHSGRCTAETGVIGADDCNPINGDGVNVYKVLNTDGSGTHAIYGPMKDWDMSLVTDISHLFYQKKTMNADLSNWDVSSVTDMQSTFESTSVFNSDLSKWSVSRVTNMYRST